MKRNLIPIALFAVFGLAGNASGQVFNPDNDSTTFFKWNAASVNDAKPGIAQPKVGDVSPDGLYLYVNGERGWTQRGHDYEFVAGGLAHTADCLPYNLPQPAKGLAVTITTGPFAEHGV